MDESDTTTREVVFAAPTMVQSQDGNIICSLMQLPTKVLNRPNETIAVLPVGIHFSGQLRKLWAAVMLISQHQGRRDEYWAYLDDLCAIAGIPNNRGKGREIIKQNLSNLRKLDIDWRGREGDTEVEKTFGAVTEHGFRSKPGQKLIVTWSLSRKAQERLINPSGFFTKMCLEILSKLKSGASVVLFEIACQYVTHAKNEYKVGKRSVDWWIDQLVGKKNSSYLYGDFKRSVLRPALAEVGEHTGIELELIEIKDGKRVAELDFKICPKNNWTILDVKEDVTLTEQPVSADTVNPDELNHKKRLVGIGMSGFIASQIIQQYTDPAYIELHLSELETAVKTSQASVTNPPGRLRKALQENWQYSKTAKPMVSRFQKTSTDAFSEEFKEFLTLSGAEKVTVFEGWVDRQRGSLKELYQMALAQKGFDQVIEDPIFRKIFEVFLRSKKS